MSIFFDGARKERWPPTYNIETELMWLVYGRKHGYMDYCSWLVVPKHSWRTKSIFNGKNEHKIKLKNLTRDDLLKQLQILCDELGKSPNKGK